MMRATLGDPDGFAMSHSRIGYALLAALLGLLGLPSAGLAQSDPAVFQVSGIEVDATAENAVAARQEAVAAGQEAGLDRLLRRLVPAENHGLLPAAGGLDVDRYVQNFEIANEELSSTRYLAQLTVRYDPQAVRELLETSGLSFAQTRSAPIVVLPVYEGPGGARLWPEDNPWWQAWADNLDPERLLRLVLPLGDLEDMAGLTVEQAQARDPAALAALARRYGSEDVLVVTATPLPAAEAAGAPAVTLAMERVGGDDRTNPPETLRGRAGQPLEELLAEAARGVQNSLDERWKQANLLRFDQAGVMVVDVPIAALSDWVGISRGLESLPEVSQVEVATFARDKVRAQIRYIGDQFRLEQALARLGLALSREGESWLLRPIGVNPSQGAPRSATSTSF
jgi:Uncharacterized protein conserved in bacteria (DUF2066)